MVDELLDIVDQSDQVIGQKFRSEVYKEKLSNFRVVNAFLINKQGQLWIPRRTKHKRLFPSCLDASVGGHVEAGESYEQALAREAMEELCINVQDILYESIGVMNPNQHKTSAFMHVYLFRTNQAPDYNKQDFFEYLWLTPSQLLNRITSGDKCKGDLPLMVKHLFK